MVDLPDAERPVNQIVKPFCLRKPLRSARERDGCHVMLLWFVSMVLEGHGGVHLRRHFVDIVRKLKRRNQQMLKGKWELKLQLY
jgi:hypothetical protein